MKLLFVTLLLLLIGWSAYAYECYQCKSLITGACADPFDKSKSGNLSKAEAAPYERCVKVKSGTSIGRQTVNVTECPHTKDQCHQVEDDGVKATICCCDSDLCNQSSSLQQSILFLLGTLFVCGILKFQVWS